MNHDRVTHDDKAFAFMMSQFPESKKQPGRDRYLATCPNCGGKQKLWWTDHMPHNQGCFACDYTKSSAFDIGYKSDNVTQLYDRSSMQSLKEFFHKKNGKHHRLSLPVISEFALQPIKFISKTFREYYNIAIPDNTVLGCTKHLNFDGRWISIPGQHRDGRKWMNSERVKASDDTVYVVAGEWDMFAFWEYTKFHAISPVDGEGSCGNLPRDQYDIFSNKHVVILFDNDKAGRAGVRGLAKAIRKNVKTKSIKCPDLGRLVDKGGEDLDDFFASGGTKERLFAEIEATPEYADVLTEDEVELERIPEAFERPDNPNSTQEPSTLNKIWKTLLLPEAKRMIILGGIAESNGYEKEVSPNLWKEQVKIYLMELETLRYIAYDQLIEEWFEKYHIKQSTRFTDMSESLYYYYKDGYYQFFSEEFAMLSANEIAQKITPPDDRMTLSRTRKQAREDIQIKIVYAEETSFDSHKDYINFSNGTYLLKEKKLVDHSPDFLLNYKLPIAYDPNAECPNFREALNDWNHNPEDKKEMLKALFYLISGDRSKQIVLWLHGDGNDGKGEFVQLCKALVGDKRTSSLALETIDKTHYSAELFNKSLNIADEVPKNFNIPDAMFKRITGNSVITGDPKYKGLFSFISKALFIIPSNHFPSVSDTSHGYFRRFKIFLFKKIQKNKEVAHFFETKLRGELAGIVNLILTDGRHYYETEGFVKTASEQESTIEMKAKNSAFLYWDTIFSGWENMVQEKMEELRMKDNWTVFEDGEKKLRAKAVLELTRNYEDLSHTQEYDVLQKFVKDGKYIYVCNTNKHYEFYKEFFEKDEVRPVTLANFRQSTINFLKDKYPERTIDKIRIWSMDAAEQRKKNLTYVEIK
jgi:P4 family phage/plasmid primase-like protien